MNKIHPGVWLLLAAIFAFGGVISLFQISSWWADQHHFNGLKGWLGIGIVLCLISIFCGLQAKFKGEKPRDR